MKAALVAALALSAACRPDSVAPNLQSADPPVTNAASLPDAPVSGTVRGAPFAVHDMRYFVDERVGYAHTDILLSSGNADTCGAITPARATSVWLRLDGPDRIAPGELHLDREHDAGGGWSVHYQVFEDNHWVGLVAPRALLVIKGVGADGRVSGGLAVCFGDDQKSCVSGSFDAHPCQTSIDLPVRGTPTEAIPPQFLERMKLDAGAHD